MITDVELAKLERDLIDRVCAAHECGGANLAEVADTAVRTAHRLIHEIRAANQHATQARQALAYV